MDTMPIGTIKQNEIDQVFVMLVCLFIPMFLGEPVCLVL
jgi:hypothetical protein